MTPIPTNPVKQEQYFGVLLVANVCQSFSHIHTLRHKGLCGVTFWFLNWNANSFSDFAPLLTHHQLSFSTEILTGWLTQSARIGHLRVNSQPPQKLARDLQAFIFPGKTAYLSISLALSGREKPGGLTGERIWRLDSSPTLSRLILVA